MEVRFLRKRVGQACQDSLEVTLDESAMAFGRPLPKEVVRLRVERHGTSCVVLLDESLDSPDHKLADLVFSQLVLEKTLIFVSLKGKSWVFEKQESPSVPQ